MLPRPILLTCQQLLAPIAVAQKKLDEIRTHSPADPKANLLREGLLVLAVSTVEYMLLDVLAVLLRQIPSKLPDKAFTVSKDSLVDPERDLLEEQIQQYLVGLSYKRLDEFIDAFCDRLSISLLTYREKYGDSLQELKESRNLLIHNDLKTNSIYLAKAGRKARAQKTDVRLKIDIPYFTSSIEVLEELCSACHTEIENKYQSFKKVKAVRELWEYVFQTPILGFDEYWEVDLSRDTLHLKTRDFHGGISSSEEIFLGVWLNHFNQIENDYIKRFSLLHLSQDSQSKMLWLLNVLKDFRVY